MHHMPPSCPRLAAAGDGAATSCPRAALYIIPALPNVRDAATWQLVKATYIDTVKRLAPAGAPSWLPGRSTTHFARCPPNCCLLTTLFDTGLTRQSCAAGGLPCRCHLLSDPMVHRA